MHLDHVTFAAGPDGLTAATEQIEKLLGASFLDGGAHPRFGTRNMVLPLKNQQYLEIVEVLDHPAAEKAAFGQAVRERTDAGGGWLGWCISVDDIEEVERRIGRHAVPGNRRRPDGFNLEWVQIGTSGMRADPQLPYVTKWLIDPSEHPSQQAPADVELVAIDIAGSPQRLADWLGESAVNTLEQIEVNWIAPNALPGILSATFATADGHITI
ncbi:glycosyltransferase [Aeromicrobium sp. Root495]|uniref:VOC family protein n=1 Tax=Aeromicrobium sp. Root495 TaxID=1736550 RepID=UPI0007020F6D|nr:VOC family protein [Aeromicrobium sp. Root495]KQY60421.1 glycosyltransferase [Aeromicrobium sp. Root495]